MKQCPYCGAQLQEQARFCLYCMRSLADKPDVTPPRPRIKFLLPVCIAAVVVLLAASLLLILNAHGTSDPAPGTSDPPHTSTAPPPSVPKEPITTFTGFSLYSSDYEPHLWSPVLTTYLGTKDTWDHYLTPVGMKNAALYLYFKNDGVQIAAALTGLAQEDLEDGQQVICRLIDAICDASCADHANAYPTAQNALESVSTDSSLFTKQPLSWKQLQGNILQISGYSTHLKASNRLYADVSVRYELRSRDFQGQTVYDICLFFDQP